MPFGRGPAGCGAAAKEHPADGPKNTRLCNKNAPLRNVPRTESEILKLVLRPAKEPRHRPRRYAKGAGLGLVAGLEAKARAGAEA